MKKLLFVFESPLGDRSLYAKVLDCITGVIDYLRIKN